MFHHSSESTLLTASLVPEPPCLFLDLRGELDLSSAHEVPLDEYSSRPDLPTVLIDVGELTFCDVAGLRALLAFCRIHAAQGRSVVVVRANPTFRRLMCLCGVTDTWELGPPTAVA
ncbi:MAG: STAS domain-containing protein [Nocardioides sp.]